MWHFILKNPEHLPRQARDKHKETLGKETRSFLQVDFWNGYYAICSLGDADHYSGENPGGSIGIFRQDTDELVSTLEIDSKLGEKC